MQNLKPKTLSERIVHQRRLLCQDAYPVEIQVLLGSTQDPDPRTINNIDFIRAPYKSARRAVWMFKTQEDLKHFQTMLALDTDQ